MHSTSFFNQVVRSSHADFSKAVKEQRSIKDRLMYLGRLDAAIANMVRVQNMYLSSDKENDLRFGK